MELDSIEAGADTVMSDDLIRLFKYAGCSPTACHACAKRIRTGQIFKLLPHKREGGRLTDEMCCAKCGEAELLKRDVRDAKRVRLYAAGGPGAGIRVGGGYSRQSKA